ncbi:cation:proton antiporter [Streptomyces monticola]|uniref:Cation:proton antiporter n=1 Tax=Streptomyces monticola TaxID=2666263 RepID=A0ABW2JEI9_9ACTN
MELTLVAVVGVISMVAVAAFSKRLGIAAPMSLVVVGIALSFVPGVPALEVEPELILAGVLPPLLYSAAVNMPATDFRRNFGAISGLAVVLVAVSTLGSGWLFHWLLPEIGWPAAFALGAVISPTDAVAATSVGKKLGLPSRLLTLLEGEGLINDASALVLLRSAIAAMAGSVSIWGVAGDFAFSVVIAVGVGLAVGLVNVRVRALLNDTVLNTAISFVVPFVAFLPAEEFEASGVLAVVVAGLVTGHQSPRYLRAQDRIGEAMNWRTLAFLLESAVFLLMGLGLKTLIDEVHEAGYSSGRALLIGLVAAAFVIVVRIAFVAPLIAVMRNDARRAAELKPRLESLQARIDDLDTDSRFGPRQAERMRLRVTRGAADVEFKLNEALGKRGGVVLAWAGMRGAITVAAAQTLPEDTPLRPQLILVAFVVAVTTLLLQGLTLPALIRRVKVPGDDRAKLREEFVQLVSELGESREAVLAEAANSGGYAPGVLEQVRGDSLAARPRGGSKPMSADGLDEAREQYLTLRLKVLDAERDRLLTLRSQHRYSSQALGHAQQVLDLQSARMEQLAESTADA